MPGKYQTFSHDYFFLLSLNKICHFQGVGGRPNGVPRYAPKMLQTADRCPIATVARGCDREVQSRLRCSATRDRSKSQWWTGASPSHWQSPGGRRTATQQSNVTCGLRATMSLLVIANSHLRRDSIQRLNWVFFKIV